MSKINPGTIYTFAIGKNAAMPVFEKEAKKEEILRKSITQEIYTPLNEYELTFKTLIQNIT